VRELKQPALARRHRFQFDFTLPLDNGHRQTLAHHADGILLVLKPIEAEAADQQMFFNRRNLGVIGLLAEQVGFEFVFRRMIHGFSQIFFPIWYGSDQIGTKLSRFLWGFLRAAYRILRPCSEIAMSVPSRFCFVSARFALITRQVTVRR